MVPLHIHTDYSILSSPMKLKGLVNRAKELGYRAVGVTELYNLFGAIEFFQLAKKVGIKPILGTEVAVTRGEEGPFRLLLYPLNFTGYQNLLYLSSISYTKYYREVPTIPVEEIEARREGLLAILPMLESEVGFHLNLLDERGVLAGAKGYSRAKEGLQFYRELFPELYLEIRRDRPEERFIEADLLQLSREVGVPIVAQTEVYYLYPTDWSLKDALHCIKEGGRIDDFHREFQLGEFHLRSPEEYRELFKDLPEGLAASDQIAEKVELTLQLDKPEPPHFKFTKEYAAKEGLNCETDRDYFRHKCWEGLEERLKQIPPELHDQYRERLQYEMEIIEQMGFPGYMLIVWDFINFAKDPSRHPEKYRKKYNNKPIPVGPGRGSAAGSLVAYALKITNIDPIRWGLLFERFLNPERVTLPDIDVDFCQERREEVLEYVKEKYHSTNVGQVVTFQSLQARGVLRDLIRIFGIDYGEGDKFVKLVPEGPKVKLSKVVTEEPKLKEQMERSPLYARLMKFALGLEGVIRGTGTHAAGVVISDTPLWEKSPLYKLSPAEEMAATQYSLSYLEPVNLIKFDFLGLKNLTIIQKAVDFIREYQGVEVDLDNLDLEDPEVYRLIQSGKTLGLFQIESEGMRQLARRLRPSTFDDIIAMLALYRPGPMETGMLDSYINRKHGREPVSYFHPEFEEPLKPILEPTYGVIVYQEQVMQIVQKIAGFSLGEADIIRRAMGKKNEELMEKYREEFVRRAVERGYSSASASDLFGKILKFAKYGFNKSHSAAYAMVTFQTAYLKTHYPTHFFAALLTYEADNTDKIATYLEEARSLGIEILPPDVNRSQGEFQPVGPNQIRFGLNGLKGVGGKGVESILKGQPFKDLKDFLLKIDSKVNRKVLEVLIKGGALDSFGYTRRTLFENLDRLLEYKRRVEEQQQALEHQSSLFSLVGGEKGAPPEIPLQIEQLPEWDPKTRLEYEFEVLGFYLSAHPLDPYREQLEQIPYNTSAEREELVGQEGLFIGKVVQLKLKRSKSGRRYGIVTLVDFHGKLEIFLFGEQLEKLEQLNTGEPVAIRARVERDGERWRITGRKLLRLTEIGEEDLPHRPRYLELRYRLGEQFQQQLWEIYQKLVRMEDGDHQVKLLLEIPSGEVLEVVTQFWKNPEALQLNPSN